MSFRDDTISSRLARLARLEADLATAIAERDSARAELEQARRELSNTDLMRLSFEREPTPLGLQIFLVLFGIALVIVVIGMAAQGFSTPVVQH